MEKERQIDRDTHRERQRGTHTHRERNSKQGS